MIVALILSCIILLGLVVFWAGLKHRNIDTWFFAYLKYRYGAAGRNTNKTKHIMFSFVDHYEPLMSGADDHQGLERVQRWYRDYPSIASQFTDADGIYPQHTFFYPQEEYREQYLSVIKQLCDQGYGEIEIHIHHDNDGEVQFRQNMTDFINLLHEKHQALVNIDGSIKFAFIHGNWALDNSRADGKWCGLNNEIGILKDLGCYADFTLPSAPSDTQTTTINSIYYAFDNPSCSKSHNTGDLVEVGKHSDGDLMIIQGPLALHWNSRVLGIWPRIENSDIVASPIPMSSRVKKWLEQAIHVSGRPEWQFVKVHSHGAFEDNADFIFSPQGLPEICQLLEQNYNDGVNYVLHYVTAREMYNIIKAAEAGCEGNPHTYRDYLLPKP